MHSDLKYVKNTLLAFILGVIALALVVETVSAKFDLFDLSEKSSDKDRKDKAKSKDKEKDDDDDDQDKAEKKREKEEKKRAEKAARAKSKSGADASESVAMMSETPKSSSKSESKRAAGPAAAAMGEAMETVNATVETEPVPSGGDAADDPAIWVNPADPSKSTIIGTDKLGGLAVYDLGGKQLQYLPDGRMDNVDLRDSFTLGGRKTAIVTASNRQDNSIAVYKVNSETRLLEPAAARSVKHGIAIYGNCMYRSAKSGKLYYFGTSKSGDVEQFELFDNGSGKVDAKSVRKFKVGSVVEGCVADDELGHFYVSEEAIGIWKYSAEPDGGEARTLVDKAGGGNLVSDIEGLTIAYGKDGKGYLIASSQGNHSYVVYRREGKNEFVKKFRVGDGSGIDGAEETDGIDVTTANLGPAFPNGVFVVQDGFNDKGNQNFKLIPFQAIIRP
ncbi:MAG: phytase [Blastocatellia bacterium]